MKKQLVNMQLIGDLEKKGKALFTGLLFGFLYLGCGSTSQSDLDIYFERLELESPRSQIEEFKLLSLDTAVLLTPLYRDIFIEASIVALHDPIIERKFRRYLDENDIPRGGDQVKMAINAAFHCYLNKNFPARYILALLNQYIFLVV